MKNLHTKRLAETVISSGAVYHYRTVHDPLDDLSIGQHVMLHTADGGQFEFTVSRIDNKNWPSESAHATLALVE
jgi:hypothetical protein